MTTFAERTSRSVERPEARYVPTEPTSRHLAAPLHVQPAGLASIRRAVGRHLRTWGYGDLEDSVTLCLTELLANVGRHTGSSACFLTVEDLGTGVRVDVADSSSALPILRQVDVLSGSGRGLLLVDRLATRWGSRAHRAGKSVWAEFHTGAGAGAGAEVDAKTEAAAA